MKWIVVGFAALLTYVCFTPIQASAASTNKIVQSERIERLQNFHYHRSLDPVVRDARVTNLVDTGPMRFSGIFSNTTFGVGGSLVLDLTINFDDTIEGYVNFSQFDGEETICGAGNFEGIKSGEMLEFNFTSDDEDPGCDFDTGTTFAVEAQLSDNNSLMSGSYSTGSGQQGVLEISLVPTSTLVHMPLIRS